MPRTTRADALQNIDRRLANVEQILPTLPTRDEMHASINSAVAEAVAPLPTRDEMHAAIKSSIAEAIAPLATRAELQEAIAPLATRAELQEAIAPLATRAELQEAIAPLATRAEMHMAIAEAVAPLATREEMRAEGELTRHHFDVVAERLESQIQVIIEGFGALNERVTVVQLASEDRDASLDRRVMQLEARARR